MVFQIMIPFQYKCIFEGIFFTIHTSYILKVVFVCMSDFDEQNMVITDQILIKSLKNLIFGCVAPGHWNSRKMEIIVLFWQISLFWPQCIPIMIQQSKKLVQSCFNTDFEIFTKKLGVLPRLPEYPHSLGVDWHHLHPALTPCPLWGKTIHQQQFLKKINLFSTLILKFSLRN